MSLNIVRRPRHFFLDVEALGPPGYGSVFAVGLVRFVVPCYYGDGSDSWQPGADRVVQRWRWNVIVQEPFGRGVVGGCDANTVAWLMDKPEAVRLQLVEDQKLFPIVWHELRTAILGDGCLRHDNDTVIWADDWQDPAWIDVSARSISLASVRDLGYAADSCALVELAQHQHPKAMWPTFQGTQHVAVDDAAHGARMLCRAAELLVVGGR